MNFLSELKSVVTCEEYIIYFQPLALDKLQQIQRAMEMFQLQQGMPKSQEDAQRKKYLFWDTQPVPKLGKQCYIW